VEVTMGGTQEEVLAAALELKDLCEKVLDPFGKKFRQKYKTEAQLTSPAARMELYSVALILLVNIAIVERTHSANRRASKASGTQGRAPPVERLSASQAIRHELTEARWLGDRSAPGNEEEPEFDRNAMRGPWLWNTWLAKQEFGPAPTAQVRVARTRELKQQFDELTATDLEEYQTSSTERKNLNALGENPVHDAKIRRQTAARRRSQILKSHVEAGPRMQKEIQEIMRTARQEADTTKENAEKRMTEIMDVRRSDELLERACQIIPDLRDVKEFLVPLSGQAPGEPLVFWFSTVTAGGDAVPPEVWTQLTDPALFELYATEYREHHDLVEEKNAPSLANAPKPSYCFRAGRCVCGPNLKFLIAFKKLRTAWTKHITLKEEKDANLVVEVTGSLLDQPPSGNRRLFWHISGAVGQDRALWQLQFLGVRSDPPRIRLRTMHRSDGAPVFVDWWGLIFKLVGEFEEMPMSLNFYDVVTTGQVRIPWQIQDLDVRRRELVGLHGISLSRPEPVVSSTGTVNTFISC
jgi:hypothetical protein